MFQHNRQYRNSTLVCSPISILCIMCRMIYNFKHQEVFISFQLNMRNQIASSKGKKCLSLLGIRRFLSILGKVLMLGCCWIIRWLKLKIEEGGVLWSVVMERALKEKEWLSLFLSGHWKVEVLNLSHSYLLRKLMQ